MIQYALRRTLYSVGTLFIIITLVFSMLRLMPDEGYLGPAADKMTESQREAILTNLGLRDPLHVQLGDFYTGMLNGDLGESITYRPKVPVLDIIKEKIPYSLAFGFGAVFLALMIGVPLGVSMARWKNAWWDKVGTSYIVFVNAVPAAVYFLLIQLYVTDILKLPMLFSEYDPITWILPLVSMALGPTAAYAMWMRRYMVDELNRDYIKLARAKGVKERDIMVKHVLRNAFIPMAQYLPTTLLYTIAGSIYIESLYSVPGMGGLLVEAIQRQDNTLVQALVLMYASLGIIGLILGDILMALVDPRIKLGKGGSTR